MSRCIKLALVLSIAACEHAPPSTTPSVVLQTPDEPTPTKASSIEQDAPPPAATRMAKPAIVAPEPEYEEVRLMTRGGPKWGKQVKTKPRVTREPVVAEPEPE